MKPKDYLKAIESQLNENSKPVCQDCGERSMLSHAVVDHVRNQVTVICDDCYQANYNEWLYGKPEVH